MTAKTKRARKADAPLSVADVEVSKMEAHALAEAGLAEWADGLPDEDAEDMVHTESWTPVRWEPAKTKRARKPPRAWVVMCECASLNGRPAVDFFRTKRAALSWDDFPCHKCKQRFRVFELREVKRDR